MKRKYPMMILVAGILLTAYSISLFPGAAFIAGMSSDASLLIIPFFGYALTFIGLVWLIATFKKVPRYLVVLLALAAWFVVYFLTALITDIIASLINK